MTLSTARQQHETLPVSAFVFRRGMEYACVLNAPESTAGSGVSVLLPPLSELIDDAWPVLWHLIERQTPGSGLPVYLFYVNPRDPVEENASRLLSFLRTLHKKKAVWAPLSTSHAAILHAMRMILPELTQLRLADVHFLYMGDNANRKPLEAMAADSCMPFAFHALY